MPWSLKPKHLEASALGCSRDESPSEEKYWEIIPLFSSLPHPGAHEQGVCAGSKPYTLPEMRCWHV